MESTNRQPSQREVQRAHACREERVELLLQAVPQDGTAEPLARLELRRASELRPLGHGTSSRGFCVIAQGSKDILLGDRQYRF